MDWLSLSLCYNRHRLRCRHLALILRNGVLVKALALIVLVFGKVRECDVSLLLLLIALLGINF